VNDFDNHTDRKLAISGGKYSFELCRKTITSIAAVSTSVKLYH